MSVDPGSPKTQMPELKGPQAILEYKQPNLRKATWQLLDTFVPYLALWILMVFLVHLGYSCWILLALTIPRAFSCCAFLFSSMIAVIILSLPRAGQIESWVISQAYLLSRRMPTGDVPTADITIRPKTWTAGRGRYLDLDGRGVLGGSQTESTCVPGLPKSLCPFWPDPFHLLLYSPAIP